MLFTKSFSSDVVDYNLRADCALLLEPINCLLTGEHLCACATQMCCAIVLLVDIVFSSHLPQYESPNYNLSVCISIGAICESDLL